MNERNITRYQSGDYLIQENHFLQFGNPLESYIADYNAGNVSYQNQDYEKAMEQFEKALTKWHPQNKRDCQIRINYALSVLNQIKLTDLTDEEIAEQIAKLTKTKEILCEKSCANEEESLAHSEDAQTLKDMIDFIIQKLQNAKPQEQEGEQEGENTEGQSVQDQLKEIQSQANQERQRLESQGKYIPDYRKIKNW